MKHIKSIMKLQLSGTFEIHNVYRPHQNKFHKEAETHVLYGVSI